MSGTNDVKAILRENYKFSEVNLFRKLLLIIFIVEKAASQVYVDPNIDRMNTARFHKFGNSC